MFEIPQVVEEASQYDGSRIFTRLAEICGLSIDLVSSILHFILIFVGCVHSVR